VVIAVAKFRKKVRDKIDKKRKVVKNKKCTQRAQTSADPEDPDFGLWTPGSVA